MPCRASCSYRVLITLEENAINASELSQRAAQAALGKKAEELIVLDVRGLASYCDFFVVCHGTNTRQVHAIAQAVRDELHRDSDELPLGVEGTESARWVLVDYGDVIVHVFEEPVRRFYDLDGLWVDAPRVPVADAPARAAVESGPVASGGSVA